MYQSVCLISEERNECVIATEVSDGPAFLLACARLPLGSGEKVAWSLLTPGAAPEGGLEPLLGRPGSVALGSLLVMPQRV